MSDSHDDITNTHKAMDIFEQNDVKIVIHAGDIISPPIVKEFARLTEKGIKLFGILGNNDGEKRGLQNAFDSINGRLLGDIGKIEIDGLKFGIYHGQDLKKKEKLIKSNKFDVFIYGHTHTKDPNNGELKKVGKTIVLNPGSVHRTEKTHYTNPQYFKESSILVFDTISKQYKFFNL